MSKGNLSIYATVGVLAYIIADISHEVTGHGATCLLLGNKITLLSSVYFKSTPGNIFVDIGGPIASLFCGLFALLLLKRNRKIFSVLLLTHISVYNLFWFAGTALQSAVSQSGDWTFAIKALYTGQYEKYILGISGILLYVLVAKILTSQLAEVVRKNSLTKQDFIMPFIFASISAFVAGLFFIPGSLHPPLEGLLEMAASIPILFFRLPYSGTGKNYQTDYKPVFVVVILYLLFCLTLGRGIKF